jgi:ureidoglycolate dehydrogenase (NAD+)
MPGADPSGFRQNGLAIAIKISAFVDINNYRNEVDLLASAIKSLPRAEGVEEIYAPGERGDAVLAERSKNGIPLPRGTWDRLSQSASALGVEMPNISTSF